MPAIFSRSFDGHVRQAVVGLVVAVGLFAVGWYYYALPSYTRVGYTPEQPVPFSHELHVGKVGLDCAPIATSRCSIRRTRPCPLRAPCMNCHDPKKANVKGNSLAVGPRADERATRAARWSGNACTSSRSTPTSTTRST